MIFYVALKMCAEEHTDPIEEGIGYRNEDWAEDLRGQQEMEG